MIRALAIILCLTLIDAKVRKHIYLKDVDQDLPLYDISQINDTPSTVIPPPTHQGTSINDIKIVKRSISTKSHDSVDNPQPSPPSEESEPNQDTPFNQEDVVKLLETSDQRPSPLRPAWKQRFEEKQKELPPIQAAAKKAIEFNGRLDSQVRASMGLEPYEGLQPPSYEMPLKIRDFAAEAAAKKRLEGGDQQPQQPQEDSSPQSELTQDKFVNMLPADLRERLKIIEQKYRLSEEEEPMVDDDEGQHVHEEQLLYVEEEAIDEGVADEIAEENNSGYHLEPLEGFLVGEEGLHEEMQFLIHNDDDHMHIQVLDDIESEPETDSSVDEINVPNNKKVGVIKIVKVEKEKIDKEEEIDPQNEKENADEIEQDTFDEEDQGDVGRQNQPEKDKLDKQKPQKDQPEKEELEKDKIQKDKPEKPDREKQEKEKPEKERPEKDKPEKEKQEKEKDKSEMKISDAPEKKDRGTRKDKKQDQSDSLEPEGESQFQWLQQDYHELTETEFSQFLQALPSLSPENQQIALQYALQKTSLRNNEAYLNELIVAINEEYVVQIIDQGVSQLSITLAQLHQICQGLNVPLDESLHLGKSDVKSLNVKRRPPPPPGMKSVNIANTSPESATPNEQSSNVPPPTSATPPPPPPPSVPQSTSQLTGLPNPSEEAKDENLQGGTIAGQEAVAPAGKLESEVPPAETEKIHIVNPEVIDQKNKGDEELILPPETVQEHSMYVDEGDPSLFPIVKDEGAQPSSEHFEDGGHPMEQQPLDEPEHEMPRKGSPFEVNYGVNGDEDQSEVGTSKGSGASHRQPNEYVFDANIFCRIEGGGSETQHLKLGSSYSHSHTPVEEAPKKSNVVEEPIESEGYQSVADEEQREQEMRIYEEQQQQPNEHEEPLLEENQNGLEEETQEHKLGKEQQRPNFSSPSNEDEVEVNQEDPQDEAMEQDHSNEIFQNSDSSAQTSKLENQGGNQPAFQPSPSQEITVKRQEPTEEDLIRHTLQPEPQMKSRSQVTVNDPEQQTIRRTSPHNDELERPPSRKEEHDIQEFLRSRGIEPDPDNPEPEPAGEDVPIDDDFMRYVSGRQPPEPNPQENERIVVQYPAQPKKIDDEDSTKTSPIANGNVVDILRAKDIFDRPDLRGGDDIFVLQSLASGKMSNVRNLDEYIVRSPKNDLADGVRSDSDAKESTSKIDAKYIRWEENRMHGEKEMEHKAMKQNVDQLLPPKTSPKPPNSKPPIASPSRQQLIQSAETHVDLNTIQCQDTYHGPWQRSRDFVCSQCHSNEAVILDDDSWYLVGMVALYQKQFQAFLNEMKSLFEKTISLVAFSKDQVCFAGEKLNVRVNISQLLNTFHYQTNTNQSTLIQVPEMLNTSYMQVRYVPSAEIQFKDLKMEASEPINLNLPQGLSLLAVGADIKEDMVPFVSFTYIGEFRLKSHTFGFNYENAHAPNQHKQTLELSLQLPRDMKFVTAISEKYFGYDLTEQLDSYLRWKNPLTGNQLRNNKNELYKLQISIETSIKDFDVSFRLKEQ